VTAVRFGIQGSGQLVGELPPPLLFLAVAERAEELGYDSLWAGDHVSFENPILDVTVALATFAAVTSRITIGAGIVLLPLRPPALVAKEFASLDYVSGGRVVLGVGVGGESPQDFEAVGVPIHERGARADEAMLALRELFAHSPASFEGRFTRFAGVSIEPRPTRPGGPPLWVGGRSPAALRRAGRLGDGWLPIWVSPERYAAGWSEIRRHAESAGRDPGALVPAVVVPALVADDGPQAREHMRAYLGVRYGTSFSQQAVERYCIAGTPTECAARVQGYVAAGIEHIVFNPAVTPDRLLEQVERLADAVVAVVA
jgi:probable F420-dependent oxidoreductase